ncbi:MAG: transporter, partial [Gemmatimonadota bacterium]|nr:transporter [Gemmatimonadota bacterium]
MRTPPSRAPWLTLLSLLLTAGPLRGQELEPRSLQNAPVGLNILLGGVGYARGNVLVDAALPLEDVTADVGTLLLGAFRSIGIF